MRKYNFEWYVLNENPSTRKIEPFNIFDNIRLYEATVELCDKWKESSDMNMTWEDFVEELRRLIQWQEWSRREYEIMVAPLWGEDKNEWRKIDCYTQAELNIDKVARYVISEYTANSIAKEAKEI